jgi:(3S)-linalool synthase
MMFQQVGKQKQYSSSKTYIINIHVKIINGVYEHGCTADDVLQRFTDDDSGEFKLPLSKDIRGLLSLHDMSHLNIGGEPLLYKAKEFSSKHLASAITYLEPSLEKYVRQSLDHPYHLSLMQYKARHHLTYLQSLPIRDTAVEKLAVAEFQLNKLLHQKEIQEIKRYVHEC